MVIVTHTRQSINFMGTQGQGGGGRFYRSLGAQHGGIGRGGRGQGGKGKTSLSTTDSYFTTLTYGQEI